VVLIRIEYQFSFLYFLFLKSVWSIAIFFLISVPIKSFESIETVSTHYGSFEYTGKHDINKMEYTFGSCMIIIYPKYGRSINDDID
jgi:hypothetical protein